MESINLGLVIRRSLGVVILIMIGFAASAVQSSSFGLNFNRSSGAETVETCSGNCAKFVSQNVPLKMTPGQEYPVSFAFKNNGTKIWKVNSYYLSSLIRIQKSNFHVPRVSLTSDVLPGQQTTFTFQVTAPEAPGYYRFRYQMRNDDNWFGHPSPQFQILVGLPRIDTPKSPVVGGNPVNQNIDQSIPPGSDQTTDTAPKTEVPSTTAPPSGTSLPPVSPTTNNILPSGLSLSAGQSITSPNGSSVLVYQGDGNFVLYQSANPLWASNTSGTAPGSVAMQGDGNLVVYDSSGKARWASNTGGQAGAYLQVYDNGTAAIIVSGTVVWSTNPNSPVPPPSSTSPPPPPTTSPPIGGTGLRGNYCSKFSGIYWLQVDPQIAFYWGRGGPGPFGAYGPAEYDNFTIDWRGEIDIPIDDTYTFYLDSDDGSKLFIDDFSNPLINNWSDHGMNDVSGTRYLTAGQHKIMVNYYENKVNAGINFFWSSNTISKQVVPSYYLYPATFTGYCSTGGGGGGGSPTPNYVIVPGQTTIQNRTQGQQIGLLDPDSMGSMGCNRSISYYDYYGNYHTIGYDCDLGTTGTGSVTPYSGGPGNCAYYVIASDGKIYGINCQW